MFPGQPAHLGGGGGGGGGVEVRRLRTNNGFCLQSELISFQRSLITFGMGVDIPWWLVFTLLTAVGGGQDGAAVPRWRTPAALSRRGSDSMMDCSYLFSGLPSSFSFITSDVSAHSVGPSVEGSKVKWKSIDSYRCE